MKDDTINIILERLQNKNVIFIIGAGFSVDAGLPDADSLKKEIMKHFHVKSAYDLADSVEKSIGKGNERHEIEQFIRDLIHTGIDNIPSHKTDYIKKFTSLNSNKYMVTTNYDTLLEESFESKTQIKVIRVDSDLLESRVFDSKLYKIFGCVSDNFPLVLTTLDFEKIKKEKIAIFSKLQTSLIEKSIVIVGFRARDTFFIKLFLDVLANLNKKKKRIIVVSPDISDTDRQFFEELGRLVHLPMTAEEFVDALYMQSSINNEEPEPIQKKKSNSQKVLNLLVSNNPFYPYRTDRFSDEDIAKYYETPPSPVSDIELNDNYILVGFRGTGKSMLLKHSSTNVQLIHNKEGHPNNTDSNFTVYIKIDNSFVEETEKLYEENDEEWYKWYLHYLNLTISVEIISTLREMEKVSIISVPQETIKGKRLINHTY